MSDRRDTNEPFPIGGDKPLKMKATTLGAIIVAAVAAAAFAENLRRDVADQGAILMKVVVKQDQMSYKLDRLEWTLTGKRGPAPDRPEPTLTHP